MGLFGLLFCSATTTRECLEYVLVFRHLGLVTTLPKIGIGVLNGRKEKTKKVWHGLFLIERDNFDI